MLTLIFSAHLAAVDDDLKFTKWSFWVDNILGKWYGIFLLILRHTLFFFFIFVGLSRRKIWFVQKNVFRLYEKRKIKIKEMMRMVWDKVLELAHVAIFNFTYSFFFPNLSFKVINIHHIWIDMYITTVSPVLDRYFKNFSLTSSV